MALSDRQRDKLLDRGFSLAEAFLRVFFGCVVLIFIYSLVDRIMEDPKVAAQLASRVEGFDPLAALATVFAFVAGGSAVVQRRTHAKARDDWQSHVESLERVIAEQTKALGAMRGA